MHEVGLDELGLAAVCFVLDEDMLQILYADVREQVGILGGYLLEDFGSKLLYYIAFVVLTESKHLVRTVDVERQVKGSALLRRLVLGNTFKDDVVLGNVLLPVVEAHFFVQQTLVADLVHGGDVSSQFYLEHSLDVGWHVHFFLYVE